MTKIILRHKVGETDGEGDYLYYDINNAWIETKNARRKGADRAEIADTFALYIIFGRSVVSDGEERELDYLPPYAFAALSPAEREGKWTVDIGDRVYVDDCGTPISPGSEPAGEKYTVNSVITCRRGRKVRHVEVTGRGRVID